MDEDTVNSYDCTLCKTETITEKNLVKHHTKQHQTIPYEINHYKLVQTRLKRAQCIACGDIIHQSQCEDHRVTKHPKFFYMQFLFKTIWMVDDPVHGLIILNPDGNVHKKKCNRCKIMIRQSEFFEHFKRKHQNCLTSTVSVKKRSRGQKRRQNKENGLEMLSIGNIKKEKDVSSIEDGANEKWPATQAEDSEIGVKSIKKEKEDEVVPIPTANEANMPIKEEKDEPMNDAMRQNTDTFPLVQDGTKFFNCSICNKRKICEKNLLKHHTNNHPHVPFQADRYILCKILKKKLQCNICQMEIDELNLDEHRQQNHPRFLLIRDLFETISVTYDPRNGETKWTRNKDGNTAQCQRCRVRINRNYYLEHFETFHPEMLVWNRGKTKENHKQNVNKRGKNADKVGSNGALKERQPFYKISVSHSEVQRLFQQNRIYAHNGDFVLKDSV